MAVTTSPLPARDSAKIVVGFFIIGMKSQGHVEVAGGFVELSLAQPNQPEFVVGHPASWVSCQGREPERFRIGILFALDAGQHAKDSQEYRAKEGFEKRGSICRPAQSSLDSRRRQGQPAQASQILKMVRHKRIAKRIDIKKSQRRK